MGIIRNKRFKIAFYFLFIVLTVYLITIFPPSGDDFIRIDEGFIGFKKGIERAVRLYNELNGRIVGNGISYVFIHQPARTIFKFFSFLILMFFTARITRIKSKSGYLLVAGLLFYWVPKHIFRTVAAWNAGFFNYVPPLVIISYLIYLLITKRKTLSLGQNIFAFVLAFVGALFMENLSLYLIFMPVLAGLIFWKGERLASFLSVFAGGVLGNILMFLSPIYSKVAENNDSYRDLAKGSVNEIIKTQWPIFGENMLAYNTVVVACFIILFAYIIYKDFKEGKKSIYTLPLVIMVPILVLADRQNSELTTIISLASHLLFYLTLLIFGLMSIKNYYGKLLVFSCLTMAFAMGPLLLVNPVSNRNFYTPIFVNLLIILSIYRLKKVDLVKKYGNYISYLLLAMLVVRLGIFLFVYHANYQVFLERERIVQEAIDAGEDQVEVPDFPYPKYGGSGVGSMGNHYYRNKRDDIEINFENYDEES